MLRSAFKAVKVGSSKVANASIAARVNPRLFATATNVEHLEKVRTSTGLKTLSALAFSLPCTWNDFVCVLILT